MNQTDFAKKIGVTRQAINKAIRTGMLIKHGEGRAAYIDLGCPVTKAYMKASADHRAGVQQPKPKAPKPKPRGKTEPPPPSPDQKESPPAAATNMPSVNAFLDKQEAERLKKLQEIEKLTLQNRARRNELIERDAVQEFIQGMHEIDNGQWKTLGLKISSDVAAAFGIDDDQEVRKACDVIDREVLAVLKQIKREQNKFLKSIGAQKLPAKGKAA